MYVFLHSPCVLPCTLLGCQPLRVVGGSLCSHESTQLGCPNVIGPVVIDLCVAGIQQAVGGGATGKGWVSKMQNDRERSMLCVHHVSSRHCRPV
jgi:hypothetical protein